MTDFQRTQIISMRNAGYGYKKIAFATNLSVNTIKSFCQRNNMGGVAVPQSNNGSICIFCGKSIQQTPGRKTKRFCSDKCRNKWWNSHLDLVQRKANYTFICPHCQKSFTVYGNPNRKYCSHKCYIADRFGGNKND